MQDFTDAIVMLNAGRFADAERILRAIIASNPNNVNTHNSLGVALFQQQKIDEGIEAFHRAIAIDPNHVSAHANLGGALLHQRRVQEAIEPLRRAVSLAPEFVAAHNNLAVALDQSGDAEG